MTAAAPDIGSLAELVCRRARDDGAAPAYVFLPERGAPAELSFAELETRARRVAAALRRYADSGERALLLFPPGLDFIVAFCGCLFAGILAVPMMPPRRDAARDAGAAIIADCAPALALAAGGLLDRRPDVAARLDAAGVARLRLEDALQAEACHLPLPERDDVALLQYTSGSTSAPKGVVVSHANLLANSEMIRRALGNTRGSTHVSWVPHYHDMGLVLNLVQTLYLGALCVLLAPAHFMRRPLAWLRAIHDYRAEVATAPDFAYDLCTRSCRPEAMAGIDLSGWRVALNGAEPVRAATLDRFAASFAPYGFAADALYPAYGMAEATLLISAGRRGAGPVRRRLSRAGLQRNRVEPPRGEADAQIIVGCGRALERERVLAVDPQSRCRLAAEEIGEIWVAGDNVAQGYWRQPEATQAVFGGRLAVDGSGPWLRTGDLGFLDAAGELYVTGRIKDVIIIRGINHYPQDIEASVGAAHPALAPHAGAAFAVADGDGAERLVIVHEIERSRRHDADAAAITAAIREAISRDHDLAAWRIALLRPGGLPKTTSGKVQRSRARRLWIDGELDAL